MTAQTISASHATDLRGLLAHLSIDNAWFEGDPAVLVTQA